MTTDSSRKESKLNDNLYLNTGKMTGVERFYTLAALAHFELCRVKRTHRGIRILFPDGRVAVAELTRHGLKVEGIKKEVALLVARLVNGQKLPVTQVTLDNFEKLYRIQCEKVLGIFKPREQPTKGERLSWRAEELRTTGSC